MKQLIGAAFLSLAAMTAQAQTFHSGDGSIIGSLCAGLHCTSTEVFATTPARLEKDRIDLVFEEESGATFPSTDWNIQINGSGSLDLSYVQLTLHAIAQEERIEYLTAKIEAPETAR